MYIYIYLSIYLSSDLFICIHLSIYTYISRHTHTHTSRSIRVPNAWDTTAHNPVWTLQGSSAGRTRPANKCFVYVCTANWIGWSIEPRW